MIFVIIFAALVLGVALMNEYGWADLTGNTRNNLVFETRNKKYGAYEIRQKYSNRLVIAFFGSLGLLTLAAFSPKFIHTSANIGNKPDEKGTVTTIYDNTQKKEEIKKEEIRENKEMKKPAAPKKPDLSTIAQVNPKPTDTKQPLDTAQKPKDAIVSNTSHIGKDKDTTGIAVVTRKPGDCIDCPEKKQEDNNGGGIKTPPEVTEQAEFDYKTFFRKNLRIPDEVYGLGLESGKVYVSFVVDEQGNVSGVSIKKGVVPVLDNEVKRVASIMPKWKPAKFNENNVKVRMIIPVSVTFKN